MKSFLYTYQREAFIHSPMATVVIAVYNGGSYIKETIESVLQQDYEDFELLLIDDGSTDDSVEIIRSFQDSRMTLIQQYKNLGIVGNGNCGFALAQGKYIFLLGHDDLCRKQRLSKQIDFMEKNPNIGICGSWMHPFPAGRQEIRYPCQPEMIQCELLFSNPVGAPSTVLRKQVLLEAQLSYRKEYACAEDYDLWVQAAQKGVTIANLPEALVDYRIHERQMSSQSRSRQLAVTEKIQYEQLCSLGIVPTQEERKLHFGIGIGQLIFESVWIERYANWFIKLSQTNKKSAKLPIATFQWLLEKRWEAICKGSVSFIGQEEAERFYRKVIKEMKE